jgi:hypothetical protein
MARRKREMVFLIHIWPVEEEGKPAWRASLESVQTGERQGFASPEDLFAFIKKQLLDPLRIVDNKNKT